MEIKYQGDWPDEITNVVAKHFDQVRWMIPGWCQLVVFIWEAGGDDKGTSAQCRCDYEYRRIVLYIFPRFLDGDDAVRREDMVHELLHGLNSILVDYATNLIKRLLPKDESPKFREHVLAELQMHNESFVQDFAYCINRRLMTAEVPP